MLPASKAAQAGQVAVGDLIPLEGVAQYVQIVLGIGTRSWNRPNVDELRYLGRLQKPHELVDRAGGMSDSEKRIAQSSTTPTMDLFGPGRAIGTDRQE